MAEFQKVEIVGGASSSFTGYATNGSNTTLEDTRKDVPANMYQNGRMHIIINSTQYVRTITSNTANTWTFEALPVGVAVSNGDKYWVEG